MTFRSLMYWFNRRKTGRAVIILKDGSLVEINYLRQLTTEVGTLQAQVSEVGSPVTVTYRNWKGETRKRCILPIRVWFGSTQYHPSPQWFIHAIDVEKGEARDFAMADIGDDRYERLAQCMGIVPDEVAPAVQKHSPWNGSSVCDKVAR